MFSSVRSLCVQLMEEMCGIVISAPTMRKLLQQRLCFAECPLDFFPLGFKYKRPTVGKVRSTPEESAAARERNTILQVGGLRAV